MQPHPNTLQSSIEDQALIDECLDELSELIDTLDYSPEVMAFALSAQLAGLLRVLVEMGNCSADQVRSFIEQMQAEALED